MNDTPSRLRIVHSLKYHFKESVGDLRIRVRLVPRDSARWRCSFAQLHVRPDTDRVIESSDAHGNHVSEFELRGPLQKLDLSQVSSLQALSCASPSHGRTEAEDPWESLRAADTPLADESPRIAASPALAEFTRLAFSPGRPIAACVTSFAIQIRDRLRYDAATPSLLSPDDVLEGGRGVCEDFAQLAIAGMRSLGLPSRYIGGYRLPSNESKAEVKSHAWAAVRLRSGEWLAFDPTTGELCGDEHLAIGWGRNREDLPLVSGKMAGSVPHRLESSVIIERLAGDSGREEYPSNRLDAPGRHFGRGL